MRRRTFWVGMAVAIFAISWLLCGLLFFFDINLPGEFDRVKAQWEAQNIDDYRYTGSFGSYSSIAKVVITVLDGQVALIEQYENPMMPYPNIPAILTPISFTPEWYVGYFDDALPEDLSYYTMDTLFTFVEQNLEQESLPIVEMCQRDWR